MAHSPFNHRPHALRFGLPGSDTDPVASLLETAGVSIVDLPAEPPASAESLRQLTRQAGLAIIDLDLGPPALAWQRALRSHRPALPLVGLYAKADLTELLKVGIGGLDRAIKVPVAPAALAELIAPWLPAPAAPALREAGKKQHASATRKKRHAATHLSPASEANQALLEVLALNPAANRFIARGPAGAEFALLALEIAARHKIDELDIALTPPKSGAAPRLLVTREPGVFHATAAPFALLIEEVAGLPPAAVENPTHPGGPPVLRLTPLHSRLPDVAHYVTRWLSVIGVAALNPAPLLPLPPAWRHALLAHVWPGEFAELWRTLHRLALLAPDAPLAAGLAPPPGTVFSFETLGAVATPRAYRASLEGRVPDGLLTALLTALDCPDLPPGYE